MAKERCHRYKPNELLGDILAIKEIHTELKIIRETGKLIPYLESHITRLTNVGRTDDAFALMKGAILSKDFENIRDWPTDKELWLTAVEIWLIH